jgi:hypothetical protein
MLHWCSIFTRPLPEPDLQGTPEGRDPTRHHLRLDVSRSKKIGCVELKSRPTSPWGVQTRAVLNRHRDPEQTLRSSRRMSCPCAAIPATCLLSWSSRAQLTGKRSRTSFGRPPYDILAIPLAACVAYPWGILLNRTIGAALMSLSTIIVAINAELLARTRMLIAR